MWVVLPIIVYLVFIVHDYSYISLTSETHDNHLYILPYQRHLMTYQDRERPFYSIKREVKSRVHAPTTRPFEDNEDPKEGVPTALRVVSERGTEGGP